MGAKNSVPSTMEFENPTPVNVVTITQQVTKRIEDALKEGDSTPKQTQIIQAPSVCQNCLNSKRKQEEKPKGVVLNEYQKKLLDLENFNFEQKLNEMEEIARKPYMWDQENDEEFQRIKSDLLNCYKEYSKQPLNCHDNAKDYQKFIYWKQYEALLRNSEAGGDSADREVN